MSLVLAFQLRHKTLHTHVSAVFHVRAETPEPKTRCIFKAFRVSELNNPWLKLQSYRSQKLVLQSGVCFLIQWIFDHGLCHLVDLFKKFPIPQDFIWLGWINYNSSIQNHVVSSCFPHFQTKSWVWLGVKASDHKTSSTKVVAYVSKNVFWNHPMGFGCKYHSRACFIRAFS